MSLSIKTRFENLHPVFKFLLLFVVFLGALSVTFALASAAFNQQMIQIMSGTAKIVGTILRWSGVDLALRGRFITTPQIAVEVIEECTGLYEIVIFCAAVLAFPATPREKTAGLIGGSILLYTLNIIRMVFLVGVGHARPDWFHFLHIYFWQATLILMITSVWLLWIIKVVDRGARRADADR